MASNTLSRKTPSGLSFNGAFSNLLRPWNDFFSDTAWDRAMTVPAVNVAETEKAYKLSMAAPGLSSGDFQVDVDGNVLSISASTSDEKKEDGEGYSRQEYNYSSFSRSFTLPEAVSADAIDASYKDGVLELMIPKSETAPKTSTRVSVK